METMMLTNMDRELSSIVWFAGHAAVRQCSTKATAAEMNDCISLIERRSETYALDNELIADVHLTAFRLNRAAIPLAFEELTTTRSAGFSSDFDAAYFNRESNLGPQTDDTADTIVVAEGTAQRSALFSFFYSVGLYDVSIF